jgi:urease accessory protein
METAVLQVHERVRGPGAAAHTLRLTFAERRRSRFRARTDDGLELFVFLPRGCILKDGDRLLATDGTIVAVSAKFELVSTAHATDPHLLLRAAYHLGNRHVPLEITPQWVRYEHDHVLDDMVRGLGLHVETEHAPFEPEPGAHGGHGHAHGHAHGEDDHPHDDAHDGPHHHGSLGAAARCDP